MQWSVLPEWARRPLKFTAVGMCMTGINTVVLVMLVGGFGLVPVLAYAVRIVTTTQFHFYLHRKIWKGSESTTLWQQWYRFHLAKLGHSGLSYFGFMLLTVWASMHYLWAYWTCTAVLGLVNFFVAKNWIFQADPQPPSVDAP